MIFKPMNLKDHSLYPWSYQYFFVVFRWRDLQFSDILAVERFIKRLSKLAQYAHTVENHIFLFVSTE